MSIRTHMRYFLLLAVLCLQSCGFALRGNADLAFHKLYIQGGNLSFKRDLVRSLKANDVYIVTKPEEAEVHLELMSEAFQQNILSISSGGTVNEYQLVYTVNYRIRSANAPLWGTTETLQNKRDFTFDNTQLLAKQYEQERLQDNMREDIVRNIMRHLVLFKPEK